MTPKKININKSALSSSAEELEKLFIKYASMNSDVAAAYKRCKPLIDRAKSGQIDNPGAEKLDATYFSPEFDLINYRDLYEKAAELDMYLDGWNSEEEYNKYMEKIIGRNKW